MAVPLKSFIEEHGATCANWRWSWSYINEKEKFIIFGAWNFHTDKNGRTLIFSDDWQIADGRKQPGFKQSKEHVELIEQHGYTLLTFPMNGIQVPGDKAKRTGYVGRLEKKSLIREGGKCYALPIK